MLARDLRTVPMVLAAFALCGAPAVSARALSVAFSNPDTIGRYPLVGGIPRPAEWTFLNSGTPTSLAVDSRGTLFAAEFQKISVFRRNDRTSSNEIDIPQRPACDQGAGTYTDAIAVNGGGYVVATIDNTFSGIAPREDRVGTSPICRGIVAFAPGARGAAKPANLFRVPGNTFLGATVTTQDKLYVTDGAQAKVFEYSHPVAGQVLARILSGHFVSPSSSAAGPAGGLYVVDEPMTDDAVIDVFSPNQDGKSPPVRQLILPQSAGPPGNIAVGGGFIYVSVQGAIDVYDSGGTGSVTPVFTLPAPSNIGAIALGP
jgi:hypothetical protein